MFWGKKIFWLSFYESIEILKNVDVSISEKIQNFDDFSGFCSPEFDSFLRDLAIFRLKRNEQHSGNLKNQIKIPANFYNEIKLDLHTYAKLSISLSKNFELFEL